MALFHLNKTCVSSFHQFDGFSEQADGGEYIFAIEASCDFRNLFVSSSNNSISIINVAELSTTAKLVLHSASVNAIEASKSCPHIIYSASSDNTVAIWDARIPTSPQAIFSFGGEVLAMAIGMNDNLLAAGWDTSIQFCDIRTSSRGRNQAAILGEYSDTHSDIVTGLKFSSVDQSLLCSSSEDGLICVYNVSTAAEDEAVVSVFNTECPVRKFGFFGNASDGIYSLSTVETASFWHIPSAQRVASFPNARETLGMDYLIDCFYEPVDQKLTLVAGTYDGGIVTARVDPSGFSETVRCDGGHSATVRCCAWLRPADISISGVNGAGGMLITGGEDARVCSWDKTAADSHVPPLPEDSTLVSTSIDSAARDGNIMNRQREDGPKSHLKASHKQRFSRNSGNLRNKPY